MHKHYSWCMKPLNPKKSIHSWWKRLVSKDQEEGSVEGFSLQLKIVPPDALRTHLHLPPVRLKPLETKRAKQGGGMWTKQLVQLNELGIDEYHE